jgi:peptidyl-prolyl cis-trans isomerase C
MGLIRPRPRLSLLLCALGVLALASCGQKAERRGGALTEPTVAAMVNDKPIYVDDVLAEAVAQGVIKEGEDLDPSSPAFYQITEDLIETRLFAIEAEGRGLDKEPDVRHRLDVARERILANVLNENIADTALKDSSIERMYKEQVKLLKQGQQVRISQILLDSKEAALAAKRRLDSGEEFVRLAYSLSKDRSSAADGGDLGYFNLDALPDPIRQAVNSTGVGKVSNPVQTTQGWHLIRVEEKKETEPPSLESMRPQIVRWLMFDEQRKVVEKLKRAARITRMTEKPDEGVAELPGLQGPDDAEAVRQPDRPTIAPPPDGGIRMGPGGAASAEPKPKPQVAAPEAPAPRAEPGEDDAPAAGPMAPGERET